MEDKGNASGRPSEELSRDEVRAQREAKKAAKAVRKGKAPAADGGGGALAAVNKQSGDTQASPPSAPSAEKVEASKPPGAPPAVKIGQPPEGGEMTREEVMAQRAEKKKLKEARKNKCASAGPGENEGSTATTQQKPTQQQPKADKSKQTSSVKQPQKPATTATVKSNVQVKQELPQQPKPQSAEPVGAEVKQPSTAETSQTEPTAVPDESKLSSVGVDKIKAIDFQSTIQSLFRPQKVETVKDPKFQMHPLFYNLGVKLKNNVIRGTNLRCTTLLNIIKDFVECYEVPNGMTLKHGLSSDLKSNLTLLRRQCPFAIGMNNAVDHVNAFLYELVEDNNDTQQKTDIMDMIDTYIVENIEKAVEAIVLYGVEKVKSGDVIMIFSITEALLQLLQKAAEEGMTFELIIIQTPENKPEIPVILRNLKEPISRRAVRISSVNFSNAIYRMRHCTKVIIGGHGLFTTGGVMAQSGSGKLALLAATYNKPAIFLCETYKFCDRSPLDFFTVDEYVPEQSLVEDDLFEPKIKYDVTPANLVTVVITDIDVLPSTSVPVVLRVQEGRAPRKHAEAES